MSKASTGAPLTFTSSLNSTLIETILPVPYVPSASGDVTPKTTGSSGARITMSLVVPSNPSPPCTGNDSLAILLPMPLLVMFPPLRIRASELL